jgi:hypothetical protein
VTNANEEVRATAYTKPAGGTAKGTPDLLATNVLPIVSTNVLLIVLPNKEETMSNVTAAVVVVDVIFLN